MTPQKKAKKLVRKFFDVYSALLWNEAIECAIISLNEQEKQLFYLFGYNRANWPTVAANVYVELQEVKTEIENL